MKGVAPLLLALVASFSVVTVMGAYFISTSKNLQEVKTGIKNAAVLESVNALEFTKRALQQALAYSYYQAAYEISKDGGYLQLDIPTWRNYDDTSKYPSNFKQTLAIRTLQLFNQYISALQTKNVNIPIYDQIIIEKNDDNSEEIKAISSGNLESFKTDLSKVGDDGTSLVVLSAKVITLFELGKMNFITKDSVKENINESVNALNFKISGSKTNHCTTYPTPEDVFKGINSKTFSQAENDIRNSIKNKLTNYESSKNKELESTQINIKLNYNENDITGKVQYNPQPSCATTSAGGDCCQTCCNSCEYQCGTPQSPKTCINPCCSTYCCGTSYTTQCNFNYYGDAKVSVGITDMTNKYAVYDGNSDMRNIQLNFIIKSGLSASPR